MHTSFGQAILYGILALHSVQVQCAPIGRRSSEDTGATAVIEKRQTAAETQNANNQVQTGVGDEAAPNAQVDVATGEEAPVNTVVDPTTGEEVAANAQVDPATGQQVATQQTEVITSIEPLSEEELELFKQQSAELQLDQVQITITSLPNLQLPQEGFEGDLKDNVFEVLDQQKDIVETIENTDDLPEAVGDLAEQRKEELEALESNFDGLAEATEEGELSNQIGDQVVNTLVNFVPVLGPVNQVLGALGIDNPITDFFGDALGGAIDFIGGIFS